MKSDPEVVWRFRVAEALGLTLGQVEAMTTEEFSGWVEYFIYKAKMESDALKKAKSKSKKGRG